MTIFLLLIFQFHVSAFLLSSLLPSSLVEWLYFWGIAKLKRVNAELNKFVMVVVFAYFLNWINPWQSETQKFPFRLLHCLSSTEYAVWPSSFISHHQRNISRYTTASSPSTIFCNCWLNKFGASLKFPQSSSLKCSAYLFGK